MSLFLDMPLWMLLAIWVGSSALVCMRALRQPGTGLVLAFVTTLGLLHLPGAFVHALPWNPFPGTEDVRVGTAVGAVGALAFALGYLLFDSRPGGVIRSRSLALAVPPRFADILVGVGISGFLVMLTPVGGIPSVTALVSTAQQLLVVGAAFGLWEAVRDGNERRYWITLALLVVLPFVTVVVQGFLGNGMVMALIVICFGLSVYRPVWRMLLIGLVVAYGGTALYSGYIARRDIIRESVWGRASFDQRIGDVVLTLTSLRAPDIRDEEMLHSFDARLNQGSLVGLAVDYTSRTGDYANGETIWEGVVALVPRALWPDKPVRAGSSDVVSRYTGMASNDGYSIGIGYVLELYINYRWIGVVVGFALLGTVLGHMDRRSRLLLHTGDMTGAIRTYLPAMALLNVGGSFVEISVSFVAGWVVGLLVTWAVRRQASHARVRLVSA